ncbi:MAG: hypothetical protein U9N35_00160 [Euryarchaeota archaeon]|nr:hypothetical protein [Euryarchaeota archaeon]
MKREVTAALAICGLIVIVPLLYFYIPRGEGVTIPDEELEDAIRSEIGRSIGPIYKSDLKKVLELDLEEFVPGKRIENLEGLQHCTHLMELSLSHNHASDLSPLKNLTKLEMLDLGGNKITDISPVVENSGIDIADVVDIRNNPLSSTSINTYIPELERRFVDLRWKQE